MLPSSTKSLISLHLSPYPERVLQRWKERYGPLLSFWLGNQLFVIISDPVIVKDLIVTNGSTFSGRKPYFIKNQTILHGRTVTASQYGDKWRQHRRIAMTLLFPSAIHGYSHVIDYEALVLLRSLYHQGKAGQVAFNPTHYTGRFTLNNMLTISYGTRTDTSTDPLVQRALAFGNEFMELTGPFNNMVDFIPILQWLPSLIKRRAKAVSKGLIDTYGAMIERVRERMNGGSEVPDCLAKTLISIQEQEKLDQEDMCMLAAVFTLGGVHTTSSTLQWFLALIASHPEVQVRAHAELDAIVGRDSWPGVDDKQNLPYVRAVIKEVQRLHSPFWMATPHCTTADFVYNGMYIPGGTVVIMNCYAMHHDPARYADPWAFNPDRYYGDALSSAESSRLTNPMQRDHFAFGAGRRICPGMHVAEHSLWLAISRLLWAFKIEAVPGEPINLEEYEGKSGRTPLPFRVRFVPRHERVAKLLEKEE
ncbi:cytochrome P450 [Auricularia subglabra TFB-10046 SS5]|uniref:Cytochrome P450 n=1 Tax=Auricularia subglabra (strain TFB-10046 / SS5) TaxID=717982 RepID=J0DD43_AURST|nr:cytochrome P450 [Auricularia subglabra TFB-10046 SS5]